MRLSRVIPSLFLPIVLAGIACAAEQTVWQIGRFDNDYREFALAGNFSAYTSAFPKDVTFTVGKDDPAKSWSYIQPGPTDAWAHGKTHPFTIVFTLPNEPKGSYRLTIDLVNTHNGYPPTYVIDINGKGDGVGLPAGGSDESLRDASKGRQFVTSIGLPAGYLRKGENRITLTGIQGSWVLYDALRLTNDPDALTSEPTIDGLSLSPTIRFVRRGGKLKQFVYLSAQFSYPSDDRIATVKYGGKTETVHLHPGFFGLTSSDIAIDEVSQPTPMEVTVQSGGRTKTASCTVRPEKHWKLYVQASVHVDVGYTDFQENVKVRHNENESLALDLMRKYPDFSWNTESAWAEENYLTMMPAERKAEYIQRAKEGRLGCETIYGNMLTGICSHESLIRDLYPAHSMSEKYGIPFEMPMSSDVPTQVWTLPTVLAGSGLKYFSAGLNLVRGDSFSRLFSKPFYWQGPDGSTVLTWLAPGYGQASALALDADVERAKVQLDGYLRGFDRADYPYDAAFAFGGFGDNGPLNPNLASVVNAWNKTYEYPKVILCRGTEFFQYIERNFHDKIPTISGDGGVYWEDGAGSSSYETAISRRAKEDLASAEKMLSFTTVLGKKDYPADALNAAWKDAVLYDEHTWGAGGSITDPESKMTTGQWAYKARFARESAKAATKLHERAVDELAELVKVDEPSVLVFNPTNWPVKGIAHLAQANGEEIWFPAETPAMGFKLYPLSGISKSVEESTEPGNVLENRFYRLEIDPKTGAVNHLYDKELNRELVDSSAPYGLNQYLYFSGIANTFKDVTGGSIASMTKETRPGCVVMKIRGSAFNTPSLVSEVVLYNDAKRIDFLNSLNKTATYEKEAGYFAFPFSIRKPRFYVELPNGVVRPDKDMLDGGCMAWYCTQDFVAAADDGAAVVWTAVDSPLVTLSDVNREVDQGSIVGMPLTSAGTRWPVPMDNGHIYGYVFNNYWFTNYKASQGGKLDFRFSLTSMNAYDPAAASRFGQSVRSPLVTKIVQPHPGVLKSGDSLCAVSPSNVSVQAIKRPEIGDGLIIRLREVGGKSTTATVSLPVGSFHEAWHCNLVEDQQTKLRISHGSVDVDLKANGLTTILVR